MKPPLTTWTLEKKTASGWDAVDKLPGAELSAAPEGGYAVTFGFGDHRVRVSGLKKQDAVTLFGFADTKLPTPEEIAMRALSDIEYDVASALVNLGCVTQAKAVSATRQAMAELRKDPKLRDNPDFERLFRLALPIVNGR